LAFAIVTVSVDAEFGATLAGEKSSVTVGGQRRHGERRGTGAFRAAGARRRRAGRALAVTVTVSVSLFRRCP